jgi:hypothetical protein
MLDIDDNLNFGDVFSDELIAGSAAGVLDDLVARAYPDGGWDKYRQWIEFHCNPPDQIENFENAGIILQPVQLEFCSWARRMDTNDCIDGEQGSPELGTGGARGGGKSFTVFAQAAIDDCQRFPGCKVLYLRSVGKQAQEQLDDLKLAVLGHTKHHPTQGKITFPNGSRIRIGHFKYEKDIYDYLGLGYEIIIIEEATTLSVKAHRAMRKSNRTSMNMVPRIYNSTNPLGIYHTGYKKKFVIHERKYGHIMNRRRKFVASTVEDNNFLDEGYIGNLEDDTGAELRAYRYGDWDVLAGAYFDAYHYDVHTCEQLTIPHYQPIWASMDYGFQHWNMIYFHTRYEGVTYTFHEIAHRKHHPKEIAPEVFETLRSYGRHISELEVFTVGSDAFAHRGESEKSIVEQYADLGIKLTRAVTGPGSRIAGAQHISVMLGNPNREIRPTIMITRNCRMLIETIPTLQRNPNKPEDVLKMDADSDGEGGDDAYDGWRYGLYVDKPQSYKTTTEKSGF